MTETEHVLIRFDQIRTRTAGFDRNQEVVNDFVDLWKQNGIAN